MISQELIAEVKRLADPVLLIGARVKLYRSGAGYAGSCPFHVERRASFHIYPRDKRFVCFGCSASAANARPCSPPAKRPRRTGC